MTPEASQINQWIAQLLELGPEALVIVGLIVIGYLLKITPVVPNRFIPGLLFVVALVAYPLFIRSEGEGETALIRSLFIAMALWFIAWILHGLVLRRIEQKLGLFQDKPSTPEPPANP